MYAVAITHFYEEAITGAAIDGEAQSVARDLGATVYEVRLLLSSGAPAVILVTEDKEQAVRALSQLRGRGHEAVACDAAAITPSGAMPQLRHFRLTSDAVIRQDANGVDKDVLPYRSILALVRATSRVATEMRTQESERKIAIATAVATGGLKLTKSVTRELIAVKEDRSQVLYLFRSDGEPPWLLREVGTDYTSLGENLAPTQIENFRRTIETIRENAQHAAYDESLIAAKKTGEQIRAIGATGKSVAVAAESGTDLLAHILVIALGHRLEREAGLMDETPIPT
ncbi:MAG: hypothetical protein ACRELY_08800 [Polyangiaceae bacterium]